MRILKRPLMFVVPIFAFAATAMAAEGSESAEVLSIPPSWAIAPVASLLALAFAYFFYKKVMAAPEGTEKMIAIAGHVREGAYAYLFSQYRVVAFVFLLFFVVFVVLAMSFLFLARRWRRISDTFGNERDNLDANIAFGLVQNPMLKRSALYCLGIPPVIL